MDLDTCVGPRDALESPCSAAGRVVTIGGGDTELKKEEARGGGAKRGGSLVGTGGGCNLSDNSFWLSNTSKSSQALGTISDKNSRSLEDRAIEFRELEFADLFDLENRPRIRETTEEDCTGSSDSAVARLSITCDVSETRTVADIVAEGVASTSLGKTGDAGFTTLGVMALTMSVLGRGEPEVGVLDLTGDDAEADFLPKNERRLPVVVFLVSFVDCCWSTFSLGKMRQPVGTTSASVISGVDLTAASHDKEPLVFMYTASGLCREMIWCLVNFNVSIISLEVNVFIKAVGIDRLVSEGISRSMIEVLETLRSTKRSASARKKMLTCPRSLPDPRGCVDRRQTLLLIVVLANNHPQIHRNGGELSSRKREAKMILDASMLIVNRRRTT